MAITTSYPPTWRKKSAERQLIFCLIFASKVTNQRASVNNNNYIIVSVLKSVWRWISTAPGI